MRRKDTEEHRRLAASEARRADWKNWGPYVSERAWGTVREDYSANGDAWAYFPQEHAHLRAYRWNEDGLGGFCNRLQNSCMAVALWNERDPILKERLFGLSGTQGNHGEDVKEHYFYIDGTPTHSYMKMLYKYPQVEFPYTRLVEENRKRNRREPEHELIDALRDSLEQHRYFDVFIEYAKAGEEDILCRITAINRGPDAAPLHILPHFWYRNTWSWGDRRDKPELAQLPARSGVCGIRGVHRHLGQRWWWADSPGTPAAAPLLFTENETDNERVFGSANASPWVKGAFHEAVVSKAPNVVRRDGRGTKAAAHFSRIVEPGETFVVRVRCSPKNEELPFRDFDDVVERRISEADAFYGSTAPSGLDDDERAVQRAAFAGLLWSKQFYHYSVDLWLRGDPAGPTPPPERSAGRNADWSHLYNLDVISMPDKWEYPWYAAWDLAFHALPIAMVDPEWAKRQLILMLREWYMHPNGQIPAYEWALDDVNPPVHAWAAWRVYKIDRNVTGKCDTVFLERVFQKLLLNFTWWVNRKDRDGKNIFQGGFLGLDNIGVFDRSAPVPLGGHLEQSDGTAWMGMYCLNMLAIALELARNGRPYEDVATKFFEHFIYIANAINNTHGRQGLWDEDDGFYYDMLHSPGGRYLPIQVRSMLGLIPLYAVETLEPDLLEKLPRFRRRMEWFIRFRPHLVDQIASMTDSGDGGRLLLSLVDERQLRRVLQRMLDEDQFLSPYGLRSLSREHLENPYKLVAAGQNYEIGYEPAESTTPLFGGNSNWRGPVWFPVNYLMIESLQKYHHYFGDRLKVPCPTAGGPEMNLEQVASFLSRRLIGLFLRNDGDQRPYAGHESLFQTDPHWRDHLLFHEYFHGDDGKGLGASHQTGWTALVAKLIQRSGGRK